MFEEEGVEDVNNTFIREHNEKALKLSMYNYYEAEEITSIMMNIPKALMRNSKSMKEKHGTCAAEKYTLFFRTMNLVVTDRAGNKVNLKDQLVHKHLTVDFRETDKKKDKKDNEEEKKTKEEDPNQELRKTIKRIRKG